MNCVALSSCIAATAGARPRRNAMNAASLPVFRVTIRNLLHLDERAGDRRDFSLHHRETGGAGLLHIGMGHDTDLHRLAARRKLAEKVGFARTRPMEDTIQTLAREAAEHADAHFPPGPRRAPNRWAAPHLRHRARRVGRAALPNFRVAVLCETRRTSSAGSTRRSSAPLNTSGRSLPSSWAAVWLGQGHVPPHELAPRSAAELHASVVTSTVTLPLE